jgi:ABC-type multidrug transport system ATPase subunit/pSer/pThr/pTyr-binding forkhead associated (FHA) protein
MNRDLVIGLPDGERRLAAGADVVVVGRDPLCTVVIDDPLVSREHLEIGYRDGRWSVRDLSRNGAFMATGRVREFDILAPCSVRLGHPTDGPLLSLHPTGVPVPAAEVPAAEVPAAEVPAAEVPAGPRAAASADLGGRAPTATHDAGPRVRIGRAPDNDIVLDDLLVSRYHAELRRTGAGMRVVDLGSSNGTFHNGSRVSDTEMRPGDRLSVGRHEMVFDGSQLRQFVDDGRISLRADGLCVRVGKRTLLDRVSFALDECSLLAVVGPSGAGKSTLLGALTGVRPAGTGTVWYEGRDLYAEFDDLRHRIGLVPQDDILHSQLTVRTALRYAAALRFGADVTPAERDARIGEVLGQLGLAAHAPQRIDTLSGGQRKRTSVALELLTEPSLLFLDEPTSGLDPGLDRDVMVTLRELADRGRTVVVVTHSPLHLDVCDRVLVLGRGGKPAYLGPPSGLLAYFGASGYADVFREVAENPDEWADRYAAAMRPAAATRTDVPPAQPPTARQGWWRQLAILTRRMVAVTAADRMYAALSMGLPLGLALLLHVIPGSDGLGRPANPLGRSAEATQILVVLIVGAVFVGLAGGIRELVREGPIYRRERAVGLSPGAYLGSKLVVFGALTAVQAAVFVLAGMLGRPGPDEAVVIGSSMLELIVVVWLTAFACTALGLFVSAFVSTGEQTMPLLVGLVMAQLVLCGGLFAVVGRTAVEQLSWLAPSRWGYAAAAATVDLRAVAANPPADALWRHTAHAWLWAIGLLLVQAVVMTLATRLALRRHEPGRL